MPKPNLATLLVLHASIFIAGFTGVFGRVISLEAPLLTFYRTLIAAVIMLAVLCIIKRRLTSLNRDVKLRSLTVGALLCVHWILFYASIKLSNVSIGVICLAAMGFFTAFLEPLLLKRKFRVIELLLSFLALAGILTIFHFDSRYRLGILTGILSSFMASLFTITNKTVSGRGDQRLILGYEMGGALMAAAAIVPLWAYYTGTPFFAVSLSDAANLFLLASVCTIGLYFLQLLVLTKVSAFTVNLSYNLEPVYSIIIAMILFSEYENLGLSFAAGLFIIACSVFLQNLMVVRENRRRAEISDD